MKKALILFVACTLFLGGLSLFAADKDQKISKDAEKIMKEADKAFKAKEFDKALELFKQVTTMEPNYASAWYDVAVVCQNQGKLAEAAESAEKAFQLKPDNPRVKEILVKDLDYLGKKAFQDKEAEKAYGYMKRLLAVPGMETENPGFYLSALYIAGVSAVQLEKAPEAVEIFKTFLGVSKDPQFNALAEFFVGHSLFLELEKEVKPMKDEIQKMGDERNAKAADPTIKQAQKDTLLADYDKKISGVKAKMGETAKAKGEIVTYLEKSLSVKADNEDAFVDLGNYYYYANDLDKSIETYNKLIAAFPQSGNLSSYKSFVDSLTKEKSGK